MRLIPTTAVLLAAWGLIVSHASTDGPVFVAGPTVRVAPGSGELVLQDINRDGQADLVTKHLLSKMIEVRLGHAKGLFRSTPGQTLKLTYEPGAIALADLNGDAAPDLVIARRDQRREYVGVHDNTGDGQFAVGSREWPIHTAFEFYKPTIRVADINRDGRVDILTSNGRRSSIEVLTNEGGGSFSTASHWTLPSPQNMHSFEVADVDLDNHLDVVVVTRTNDESAHLRVLRGSGNGKFVMTSSNLGVLQGGRISAVADVDGDRDVDVVLTHARDTRLSVLLNSGNGDFTPAPGSPFRLPAEGFEAAVADVTKDGKFDLLVTTVAPESQGFAGALAVLVADGRTFKVGQGSPFSAGVGSYHLAVGDIDRDGTLDVATSSFEGHEVVLLLGR